MKILVVSQYFYPEQFRINDIVEELVRRGNDVSVLTGLPNYPDGEIFNGYHKSYKIVDDYKGAKIYRCKCRPRHRGTLNLLINYISFVFRGKRTINKLDGKFDVVYVYGVSPILQALPALKYKKKYGVPVVYYCMDLWPESVRGKQNGHKQIGMHNFIFLASKVLSIKIYKKIDYILCKNENFISYNNKICKVPLDKQKVLSEHAESIYLTASKMPIDNGIIDFMYLGNIGRIQNCEIFLQAAFELKKYNNIKFHFVGSGSNVASLKSLSVDLNLDKLVCFYDPVTTEQTIDFYNMADICILGLSHCTETGLTIPGKLYGYMASSRPILASIDGPAGEIIKNADCGFVSPADNLEELVNNIKYIINNFDTVKNMGINGRTFFLSNYTISKHIDGLIDVFNRVKS